MKKITLIILLVSCISCKNDISEISADIAIDTTVVAVDTLLMKESASLVDSSKVNELKSFFTHKSDEFAENKTTWIKPTSAPKYTNMNGIYCYFSENNLRFVFQFHRDDWLFIRNCIFLIDGKSFPYTPQNMKRDNDESGITEWFDDSVNGSNKDIVEALANAKEAKVKLNGDNYYDVKVITKKQISSINKTLEYYKAMGYNY